LTSLKYALIKRAIDRIIIVVVTTILLFLIMRVFPIMIFGEDPFLIYLQAQLNPGEIDALQDIINSFKESYGLDDPLFPDQFIRYMISLFTLNFGYSFLTRKYIIEEIMERLPNTLALNIPALILITLIGLFLGWYSASKRGKNIETVIMSVSIWSYIMPGWLLGILLIIALAYLPKYLWDTTIFPLPPYTPPRLPVFEINLGFIQFGIPIITLEYLWVLSLPIISIVVAGFGSWAYYIRQLTVSELGQDYILTAKAKGLNEQEIMRKHVFINVVPPVLTSLAFAIPGVFTGGILVETVFSYYGMGLYLWDAILQNDYPAIQAIIFIYAVLISISLYVADLILIILDPRVRLR